MPPETLATAISWTGWTASVTGCLALAWAGTRLMVGRTRHTWETLIASVALIGFGVATVAAPGTWWHLALVVPLCLIAALLGPWIAKQITSEH